MSHSESFDRLVRLLAEGRINRREFAKRAVGIGAGTSAALTIIGIDARSAGAQAATPEATPLPGPTGGTLKLPLPTSVDLNPIGVRTVGAFYLQSVMYDGLVVSSTNWDAVEPALAETWDLSSDGLTHTFHLRQGVQWHDGQPFTAADVAFTYKTFLTKDVGSYFAQNLLEIAGAQDFYDGKATDISGIKVIDDHTISMTLLKPNAPFVFSTLTQHSIIPEHVWKSVSAADLAKPGTWEKSQIGTGPFKFGSYQVDTYLEFDRNDNAWRGKPKLDKVTFVRTGTTPEAIAAALEKNDLDYASIPTTEIDRMSKLDNLTVISRPVYNIREFSFDLIKPYLQDKRVRQAVAYGVDRKGLCEAILPNTSQVANSFSVGAKWADPNLPTYDFNPDKAKSLLKDAGWDSSKEIELSLYYQDQGHKDFIAAAQQQLQDIGMKTKIVQLDASAVQDYANGKYDIMLQGYGLSPDMDEYKLQFSCNAVPPTGGNNGHYCNAQVDQLLIQGEEEQDDAKRKAIYDQMQAILMDELPWVPLYILKIAGGFTKRVINGEPINNVWNRPYNWHIESVAVADQK